MWSWHRSSSRSSPARCAGWNRPDDGGHAGGRAGVHPVSDRSRLRLIVLRVLVVSLLLTLFGRLWYLQVLAGPQYQRAAADNQIQDVITAAPRGQIVDDAGRAFARNRTALVVSVDRIALLRQPDDGSIVLQRLASPLHV